MVGDATTNHETGTAELDGGELEERLDESFHRVVEDRSGAYRDRPRTFLTETET